MKWIIIIVVAIVALVAILYLIGYFMPVKHMAAHTVILKASPENVWKILVDHQGYEQWRRDVKKVVVTDAWHWTEKSGNGTIHYEGEVITLNASLISRITNKDLPFGGYWTFKLVPAGADTQLTITENGEVYNPVFRFMSKYIFGHEATLKNYAADLSDRINNQ
jgi:hypothetical protein